MAESSATEDAISPDLIKNEIVNKDDETKPLQMSFADWKKIKEAKEQPEDSQGSRNSRKTPKNDNSFQGGSRNLNHNNNQSINNNSNLKSSFPPLNRPPPLPFPLVSMGFGNFGPGPCGPPPMMASACMSNMGPRPGPRNHRPLQPPPFWEDMMSPQHRPPPIQPPMPKCPSSWNLLPKEKQANNRQYKQNQNQPNKKYKTSASNNNSNNNNNNVTKNALLDAALMPPPPPPGDSSSSNSNNSSTSNKAVKKKKTSWTFVQIDGKWIQRPEAPPPLEDSPPGTKEDRQRQWREYRQAMKPFKNREFHNWKRTVQRLSKLPRDQLDEKQLDRLQKAEEYIGAHKAMLTIKHAEQWVQQSNQKTEGNAKPQGQVYVRKPANTPWHKNNDQNTFQRAGPPVRKPTFGTGRAIKGGIGGEMGNMPSNTTGPAMGQLTGAQLNCGYFGYNSSPYGSDTCNNGNSNVSGGNSNNGSNPFYANYTPSFIKGGTLLPP